ncbi:GNAT family N-acetyltransferase [Croceimicrobium sp.]|uniref:GNAT family N-acetyltransferase n=1 Tax=Croceimicrobium sp. TaxID=2828340 RepID=UPI003BA914AA
MEVIDNQEMRHFEVRVGERLAIIEYQIQERKYFLTRVDFPKKFLEDGRAEEMLGITLKMIEETGMRVVPMTRFVKDYFKGHPELKSLLPVGIHL